MSNCSAPRCTKASAARGLCNAHYHRLRRYGDPLCVPNRGSTAFDILSPIVGEDLANRVVALREGKERVKSFDAYRAQITLDAFQQASDPKMAAWEYVNRLQNREKLTQEYLKACIYYDPGTGIFTAKLPLNTRKEGDVLGSGGSSHGYLSVLVAQRSYLAHRLAWFYVYGEWPEQIDHIDRNRHNNRLSNLRPCTHQENTWNVGLRGQTASGVVGVNWNQLRRKWVAKISMNRQSKTLGYFDELSDAQAARQDAVQKYRGHFLNAGGGK